jgi:hypothetical protein
VCPVLGLLVTSDHHAISLSVFRLPPGGPASCASCDGSTAAELELVHTMGGASSRFQFGDGFDPGWLAFTPFTGHASSRLLLVTDAGNNAVHVLDVVGQEHVGYVAAPGATFVPRGIAARGSLAAVSTWKKGGSGDHVVRLFQGAGASWSALRVLAGGFGGPGCMDGQLSRPYGLRFTGEGGGLVVADSGNNRVSLFRTEDGTFVRHVGTRLDTPWDIEEYEGTFIAACYGSDTVEFVGGEERRGGRAPGRSRLDQCVNSAWAVYSPTTLAMTPSLGLAVRDSQYKDGGRVQIFATPDAIAMACMSSAHVGWMGSVVLGQMVRHVVALPPADPSIPPDTSDACPAVAASGAGGSYLHHLLSTLERATEAEVEATLEAVVQQMEAVDTGPEDLRRSGLCLTQWLERNSIMDWHGLDGSGAGAAGEPGAGTGVQEEAQDVDYEEEGARSAVLAAFVPRLLLLLTDTHQLPLPMFEALLGTVAAAVDRTDSAPSVALIPSIATVVTSLWRQQAQSGPGSPSLILLSLSIMDKITIDLLYAPGDPVRFTVV